MKKLDGRIDALDFDLGAGDDVVMSFGDTENDADAWMSSIEIDGGSGEDYINIDSSMLGLLADPGKYHLEGGDDADRIKITGINFDYDSVLLEGGLGDDTVMGADGDDVAFGGFDDRTGPANTAFDGFDLILTYDGADYIDGGDEFDQFSKPGGVTDQTGDIALYSLEKGSGYADGDDSSTCC